MFVIWFIFNVRVCDVSVLGLLLFVIVLCVVSVVVWCCGRKLRNILFVVDVSNGRVVFVVMEVCMVDCLVIYWIIVGF